MKHLIQKCKLSAIIRHGATALVVACAFIIVPHASASGTSTTYTLYDTFPNATTQVIFQSANYRLAENTGPVLTGPTMRIIGALPGDFNTGATGGGTAGGGGGTGGGDAGGDGGTSTNGGGGGAPRGEVIPRTSSAASSARSEGHVSSKPSTTVRVPTTPVPAAKPTVDLMPAKQVPAVVSIPEESDSDVHAAAPLLPGTIDRMNAACLFCGWQSLMSLVIGGIVAAYAVWFLHLQFFIWLFVFFGDDESDDDDERARKARSTRSRSRSRSLVSARNRKTQKASS